MTLSQIIVFAVGAILALFGLYLVVTQFGDLMHLAVGIVLIVIGVVLLINKNISL